MSGLREMSVDSVEMTITVRSRYSTCLSTKFTTLGEYFSRPLSLPPHRENDERSLQGSNPPDLNASVTLPLEIPDKVLKPITCAAEDNRL